MKTIQTSAPWHKASFDTFMHDRLGQLLGARGPLVSYQAEATGPHAWKVSAVFAWDTGEVTLDFADLPGPDESGVFLIDGAKRVVVPEASMEELDKAEVKCVGELLYDYIDARLGEAHSGLPWDEALARAWLPLGAWMRAFLLGGGGDKWVLNTELSGTDRPASQPLDDTNWLARCEHLRRLSVPEPRSVFAPGQIGRTCPLQTPEGDNVGKILHVAVGAEIRAGRLVIVDSRPEAGFSVAAHMVPFLEHSDPNRLLMGLGMARQWLAPADPEPAIVRTGFEPDAADFWCGRNLLTAFVPWGGATHEDGIVVSVSAARRLGQVRPLEPGDKLANRHGSKGTINQILPDDQMPHLADGTPVELVFSFSGLQTRMNFGQSREAVMGRIARAEGRPAIVPPFAAPNDDELRRRLVAAGLPESGMETLTDGKGGPKLDRPSAVGWVYWGKTHHLAGDKLFVTTGRGRANRQGEYEFYTLRDAGAFENVLEAFNTRCVDRPGIDDLAAAVAAGAPEQAPPPTPAFADLARRLAAGGIAARLDGQKVAFGFAPPEGEKLALAKPMPHPWLPERPLTEIGALPDVPAYDAVAEANAKLARMLENSAPASLVARQEQQFQARVQAFFDGLVDRQHVRAGCRVTFTGRTVISGGPELRHDQVGLPEEMCWTLFGPLVEREVAHAEVVARGAQASAALDAALSRSWVLLNRAPSVLPGSFIAARPVCIPGHVIRINFRCCGPMNADFDGDQVAVFLPLTAAAQKEAGEKLSLAGHLRRDPKMVRWVAPMLDAMWGLVWRCRTAAGRRELADMLGVQAIAPDGLLTRNDLVAALEGHLAQHGPRETLELIDRLWDIGLAAARQSGASMSPFMGSAIRRPPRPDPTNPAACDRYLQEIAERLESMRDFDDELIGPQLLAVRSGARGNFRQLAVLLGAKGWVDDDLGRRVFLPHSGCDGLTATELSITTVGARKGLGNLAAQLGTVLDPTGWVRAAYGLGEINRPAGFNVLARAMRADRPGIVFANAASTGETDPLTDLDSRLFVGLLP